MSWVIGKTSKLTTIRRFFRTNKIARQVTILLLFKTTRTSATNEQSIKALMKKNAGGCREKIFYLLMNQT